MTARYTVVQYVPDPMAGERINFGVITWDDEAICSRFVTDWRHVRSFGKEDIGFLRDFVDAVAGATSKQLGLPAIGETEELDSSRLEKMIGTWGYSIQFAEPRGSTKNAEALL